MPETEKKAIIKVGLEESEKCETHEALLNTLNGRSKP